MDRTENNEKQVPAGYSMKMIQVYKSLESLEKKLSPILTKNNSDAMAKLNPLERAKMGMLCVYTTNILFWVSMKLTEESVDKSVIEEYKVEKQRGCVCGERLKELEATANKPATDASAAKRMINHNLGLNKRKKDDDESSNKKFKPSTSSSLN